jgi:phosphoribosyl-ATP pyrophosphohydrolase
MSVKNKIIEETVETIIDKLYQESEYYMYEYGKYSESDDKFIEDQEQIVVEIIKELNNRINKI